MNKLIIQNALDGWIDGEVVARHESDRMAATIVVVRKDPEFVGEEDRFDVLRAFIVGERAEVSADVQDADAGRAFARLMEVMD